MIDYIYKILDLERDSLGIISFASYTITASDGINSNTHLFSTAFTAPKNTPIDYASVTEADVIGWIQALTGDQDQAQADAELAAQIQKSIVSSGIPWA